MVRQGETPLPGAAQLQLADGVAVLRPAESVFEAMVSGWSRQQLARNLSPRTVAARVAGDPSFSHRLRGGWAVVVDAVAGR